MSFPPIEELLPHRHTLRSLIQYDQPTGTIQDALKEAHVVIGLSSANILKPEDLALMAKDPIVFALANPDLKKCLEKYCKKQAKAVYDGDEEVKKVTQKKHVNRLAV